MKISNYKLTHCIAYLLLAIIVSSIFLIIWIDYLVSDIILTIFCVAVFSLLMRLQCVVYENSGNCVTFRKHHPFTFKKFIPPFVELPQSSIKDFNCKNNLGVTKLTFKLNSRKRKNTVVKMLLLGFTNSQSKKIVSSLQTIRLNNDNSPFS
ncbi:hypothetical protein [Chryseobacterium sp. GP-SGM7]|uniref:hypothetical protein n=1 Tax=Chryseobacterium sp. GP-SGM7 TaxID=3411323 RepID=UPI003B93F07C